MRRIYQTVVVSAVVATVVALLAIPKAEANNSILVDQMNILVDTTAAAMACAAVIGYVSEDGAVQMMDKAQAFSDKMKFMIPVNEKVQRILMTSILEVASMPNADEMCNNLVTLMRDRYGIIN